MAAWRELDHVQSHGQSSGWRRVWSVKVVERRALRASAPRARHRTTEPVLVSPPLLVMLRMGEISPPSRCHQRPYPRSPLSHPRRNDAHRKGKLILALQKGVPSPAAGPVPDAHGQSLAAALLVPPISPSFRARPLPCPLPQTRKTRHPHTRRESTMERAAIG